MKAMVLTAVGGPENLSLQNIAQPEPKDGQVLVKVHSLSINPVDVKTRKGGALYALLVENGQAILGWDISGVVEAVGPNVTNFKEGDAVFGMVNFPGNGKAYAEYVAAPASHLTLKPENSTHEEAAATTLAALTAWQVLVEQANLQRGQSILIHAAAGGVGHFAVQLAKHLGATVWGTASAQNQSYLAALGVDHFLDYKSQRIADAAHDIDVVLDPIGGDTTAQSLAVLKNGGTLVSIVGGVKDHLQPLIQEKGLTAKNYLVHSSGTDMQQLADLLRSGQLKPTISHQFSFAQIPEAHRQIESGKTRGKVVVNLT